MLKVRRRRNARITGRNEGFRIRTGEMYTHSFRSLGAGGRRRWRRGFLYFKRDTEGCNKILDIWKQKDSGERVEMSLNASMT